MAKVVLSELPFRFLEDAALLMETSRLASQALEFDSYRSVIGVAIDVLNYLSDALENKFLDGYGLFTPETIRTAAETLRRKGLKVMTKVA